MPTIHKVPDHFKHRSPSQISPHPKPDSHCSLTGRQTADDIGSSTVPAPGSYRRRLRSWDSLSEQSSRHLSITKMSKKSSLDFFRPHRRESARAQGSLAREHDFPGLFGSTPGATSGGETKQKQQPMPGHSGHTRFVTALGEERDHARFATAPETTRPVITAVTSGRPREAGKQDTSLQGLRLPSAEREQFITADERNPKQVAEHIALSVLGEKAPKYQPGNAARGPIPKDESHERPGACSHPQHPSGTMQDGSKHTKKPAVSPTTTAIVSNITLPQPLVTTPTAVFPPSCPSPTAAAAANHSLRTHSKENDHHGVRPIEGFMPESVVDSRNSPRYCTDRHLRESPGKAMSNESLPQKRSFSDAVRMIRHKRSSATPSAVESGAVRRNFPHQRQPQNQTTLARSPNIGPVVPPAPAHIPTRRQSISRYEARNGALKSFRSSDAVSRNGRELELSSKLLWDKELKFPGDSFKMGGSEDLKPPSATALDISDPAVSHTKQPPHGTVASPQATENTTTPASSLYRIFTSLPRDATQRNSTTTPGSNPHPHRFSMYDRFRDMASHVSDTRSDSRYRAQARDRLRDAMRRVKELATTLDRWNQSREFQRSGIPFSSSAFFVPLLHLSSLHENGTPPVLLEPLRVVSVRSESLQSHLHLHRTVFVVTLKYDRYTWQVRRAMSDFIYLHSVLTVKKIRFNKEMPTLPRFPFLSTGISSLEDPAAGGETDGEAEGSTFTPGRPSIEAKKRTDRPSSLADVAAQVMARYAPGTTGVTEDSRTKPEEARRSMDSAHPHGGSRTSASFIGYHPPTPADADSARCAALRAYLRKLIYLMVGSIHIRDLCIFLELSGLSFKRGLGFKGKESFLERCYIKNITMSQCCNPTDVASWEPQWVVARDSYVAFMKHPSDRIPSDVFLVDPFYSAYQQGSVRTITLHWRQIAISNQLEHIELYSESSKDHAEWLVALRRLSQSPWAKRHRFDSFGPIRTGIKLEWLVDGADYFAQVADAIAQARDTIMITDWWLTPEIHLKRPWDQHEEYRIDRLLKSKAEDGVMIYILIYKEVSMALPLESIHTKLYLRGLHRNIHVQRHPDHYNPSGVLYWAHHEKLVVVDHKVGFVGGLDLCFGRYDNPDHPLVDSAGSKHCSGTHFFGQDYSNPRIADFRNVSTMFDKTLIDRDAVPRFPWHDVACKVVGQTARDLERHFVQRWNHVKCSKAQTRDNLPLLLPSGDFDDAPEPDMEAGTCRIQVLRSLGMWSGGILKENSIYKAYVHAIEKAEHFVYIENQFFVTTCQKGDVQNEIGKALFTRIMKAHKEKRRFKVIVVMPLMPAFEGAINSSNAGTLRMVMNLQYESLTRGGSSLCEWLRNAGVETPFDYVGVFSLRSIDNFYDRHWRSYVTPDSLGGDSNGQPSQANIAPTVGTNEATNVFGGSRGLIAAGRGGQTNGDEVQGQASGAHRGEDDRLNAVNHPVSDQPKDLEKLVSNFTTEEIYIHSKVLIVDDRIAILGSANVNDRSMNGDRDSEVCIFVEDEEEIPIILGGKETLVARKVHELRIRLFKEFLGLLDEQCTTRDCSAAGMAINDKDLHDVTASEFYDEIWAKVARDNTLIYREVFSVVPDDTVHTWVDYNRFTKAGTINSLSQLDSTCRLPTAETSAAAGVTTDAAMGDSAPPCGDTGGRESGSRDNRPSSPTRAVRTSNSERSAKSLRSASSTSKTSHSNFRRGLSNRQLPIDGESSPNCLDVPIDHRSYGPPVSTNGRPQTGRREESINKVTSSLSPAHVVQYLSRIRGHLVQCPTDFLQYENLNLAVFSRENFLPIDVFR